MRVSLDTILKKSDNIVFRKIEGEYILVPVVAFAADINCIYNLNETGAIIWDRIDGRKTLMDIVEEIHNAYEDEEQQIEDNVVLFVKEMIEEKLVEVS